MNTFSKSQLLIVPMLAVVAITAGCATKRPEASTVSTEATGTTGSGPSTADANGTGTGVGTGNNANVPGSALPGQSGPRNGVSGTGLAPIQMSAREAVATGLRNVGDRIFFETDSYSLTPEAQQVLRGQAAVLSANPSQRVMIAGNCDERGTREYNLALGARRANSVRDFLISLGVSPAQLDTVSYGKERPIDDRPNPDGWAINRNSHTMILAGS
jgi:peptidoglycan-associated lipoprotein